MSTYQNQQKRDMNLSLPYYGINKFKPTEPFLTISRILYNRDNEEGTCILIDVVISGDRNMIKKESENILNYALLQ